MQQNDANNIYECLKNNNVNDEIIKSSVEKLSSSQQKQLSEILNDSELMKSIFDSPKAQAILKKLQEK